MTKEIDINWLREKRLVDLLHPAEIADLAGVSQKTIERRLKDHGIELELTVSDLDRDMLQRLYCNRDTSLLRVAQGLGIDSLALAERVVELGLPLREKYLDRQWLQEQIQTEVRSVDDVADECNTTRKTIYEYLRVFGIPARRTAAPYEDPEWCQQEHCVAGKPIRQIAREQGRNPATITDWFQKHGIPIRGEKHAGHKNRSGAPYRNESVLRQLCDRLSDEEVARELGCHRRNVQYWRKKYGIQGRTRSEATSLRHQKSPALYKDKKWCEEQYELQEKSTFHIAAELGCSPSTIRFWLMRHGIPLRKADESYHLSHANSLELSSYLKLLLEGELLGDGSLIPCSKYTAVYGHASKHKEYVEWLSEEFASQGMDQAGTIREVRTFNRDTGRTSTTYTYRSLCYPVLLEWRERFYPEPAGKKIVPEDLILNPIICRQWYLGDGHLATSRRQRSAIFLYTCAFDADSIQRLRVQLRSLGIPTTHQPSRNQLYIPADYVIQFLDYIGPCPEAIKNAYGYKWEAS